MILYTDGIPEAIDETRREYSIERLQEIIRKNRNLELEDFTSSIIEDVQRFIGKHTLEDDITVLVIELAHDPAVDIIKRSKKLTDENRFFEAIENLETGLEQYPDNGKLLYNLAKVCFRINNYEKTIESINKYLLSEKRNKFAYYLGGAAYYQLADLAKAIDYLEEALRIDQNFINANFALGMAYKKKGNRSEAVSCFERVLNLDVDHKMAMYELKKLRK